MLISQSMPNSLCDGHISRNKLHSRWDNRIPRNKLVWGWKNKISGTNCFGPDNKIPRN
jgi:hypothetical protein